MVEVNRKDYGKYIFSLFEIIAFFTFFINLLIIDYEAKKLLFILPLGFFVVSILFLRNFRGIIENISQMMIISLYFVRMVILPFFYVWVIELQLFEGKTSINSGFSEACFLMVYEYFVVQLVMYIYIHKRKKKQMSNRVVFNVDISKWLLILLVSYVVGIAIFFPQYSENFKTIFNLTDADFAIANLKEQYNVGTFGRVLKTLFSMAVQLFRILLPAYLLKKTYDKTPNSSRCTWLLGISCILQFMFLTSTFAEAIVSCLTLILFYIKLYPQRKKKLFLLLVFSTFGMLIIYFLVRYFVNISNGLYEKESGVIYYVAEIINAYFTGVDNVSAIYNVFPGHEKEALSADIIGAIPFNTTLFGDRGNKLQYYFNLYNNSYGQIPPTIGVGYYYFGSFLAPVFTAGFVLLSLRYYKMSEIMEASWRYVAVIFCSVTFALGTVMYSPAITLSWFFSWGVPMLIITLFVRDNRGGNR